MHAELDDDYDYVIHSALKVCYAPTSVLWQLNSFCDKIGKVLVTMACRVSMHAKWYKDYDSVIGCANKVSYMSLLIWWHNNLGDTIEIRTNYGL